MCFSTVEPNLGANRFHKYPISVGIFFLAQCDSCAQFDEMNLVKET